MLHNRLSRMLDVYKVHREVLVGKRSEEFAKRKETAQKKIAEEKRKRKDGSRTPLYRQVKTRARVRCSAEQGTGIAVDKSPRSLQSPRPRRRATARGSERKCEGGSRRADGGQCSEDSPVAQLFLGGGRRASPSGGERASEGP